MKNTLFALVVLIFASAQRLEAQTEAPFPYPTTPLLLSNQECEHEWYALHFWDKYDFENPYKYTTEESRQGLIVFIDALNNTSLEVATEAMMVMMQKAAASEDGYWCQLELAEEVLYDPSSPLCNDYLWEPVLRHAVGPESPLDDDSKIRYRSLLSLVSRNQMGSIATNFKYTLPNGASSDLHSIKAPYTLIFFYNPDCSECRQTKWLIQASGALEHLHRAGQIEVLAIYPDNDVAQWRRTLSENPEWWISAYDKGGLITSRELYDLKAIPTLYLLDSQKRVLMKDPTAENLNRSIDEIARRVTDR